MAALLWAQQFKFNLDHLAAKASNAVDVSLNKDMLQFAGKFLNSKTRTKRRPRTSSAGWTASTSRVSSSPGWRVDTGRSGPGAKPVEGAGMGPDHRREGHRGQRKCRGLRAHGSRQGHGIAVLATDPRGFTVANIVGNISLDSLADLGGQFGLPRMQNTPATPRRRTNGSENTTTAPLTGRSPTGTMVNRGADL